MQCSKIKAGPGIQIEAEADGTLVISIADAGVTQSKIEGEAVGRLELGGSARRTIRELARDEIVKRFGGPRTHECRRDD